MAIDTKQLYDFVLLVANKEQQGFITASDFEAALDSAQLELIKDRFNNPNTYQPGRPVSRVGYGQSGKVMDDLALVTKESTGAISSGSFSTTFPADYLHFISLSGAYGNYDLVSADSYHNVRNNSMMQHTAFGRKVCMLDSGGITCFPSASGGGLTLFYIKRPVKGTLTETVNASTGAITIATNQAISDMPEQVFNELAWRILSILGMNIKDQALTQYAEMQEKE